MVWAKLGEAAFVDDILSLILFNVLFSLGDLAASGNVEPHTRSRQSSKSFVKLVRTPRFVKL